MKKICGFSTLLLIILTFFLEIGTTSCTKEKIVHDTVTVAPKDTILTTQILTANAWKDLELRGVSGDSALYYIRGGSNHSFDNEYIAFNSNKTGVYVGNDGSQFSLTWDFANSDNTKIVYTVQLRSPGPTTVTWDNIKYKNKSLEYDEYWTIGNINADLLFLLRLF